MAHIIDHARSAPRAPRRIGVSDILGLFRQRHALSRLDDARLNDLGLTRSEAEAEARRPVWDVPTHWQR